MRRWLPPLVVLSLLAAGCGADSSTSPEAQSEGRAGGEGLEVVAAVYPLAWIAEQVAPDAGIELLNQGGQEAHDLDISPPQRAAIETADVVLYTGDIDYQPQVEEAIPAAQGEVVSATDVAGDSALLAASADQHAHEDEGHEDEGHETHEDEAHETPEDEGHEDETHETHGDKTHEDETHEDEAGGIDPHLWFDPAIMADVAVATGESFAAADPENAEIYRANAADVQDELESLHEDLDEILGAQCQFDEAIVSHAAYAYLLEPYGKSQHAVTNVRAEDDASAGELAEIVEEIRAEGFTHVLTEPVEGREGAEVVAGEAGVEMVEILPLDAVTEEQAEVGLPDLIRAQAETFSTALGCG